MKSIHKVPLLVQRDQIVALPTILTPRALQMQGGSPAFWYECDTATMRRPRQVFCVVTGGEVPAYPSDYIGTVQLHDGTVWHYYLGV